MLSSNRNLFHRNLFGIAFSIVLAGGLVVYARRVTTNPPGFFIDESSVAYNAYTISQNGRDEYGVAWPLYFRAFGEYKNPIYIYLLAAIFRITGPGILVARMFSAMLGVAVALVIGLVGLRITRQRWIGLMLMFIALQTPWLFVLSRVVVEVALYPLLVALFLLAVQRVAEKDHWRWIDALSIGATLALLTYAYSIGRLLAPMLAIGLLCFVRRVRFRLLVRVWLIYAVSLLPLLIFQVRHPGALGARFAVISYFTPQMSYLNYVWSIVRHYLANLSPWRMLWTGDPNSYQLATTYGMGPILFATFILTIGSVGLLLVSRRLNAWWAFMLYGLLASFVPASLTREYFHILRLSAVPVFVIVLTVPALAWLTRQRTSMRRALMAAAIVLTLAQGVYFQVVHQRHGGEPARLNMFDADYQSTIMPRAIAAADSRPIYLADAPAIPGYIQALWYSALQHLPFDKFVLLLPEGAAPDGAVVISTEATCPRGEIIFERSPYRIYIAKGPTRVLTQLPDDALKAEIHLLDYPQQLRAGQTALLRVRVKNKSSTVWLARERTTAPFQINLGNHWLSPEGKPVANDDGRAALFWDLAPGQELEFTLTINAPGTRGDYLLELDLVQEGNTWFGLKGSPTVRQPIVIN